jgi:hypothetical protein
LSEIVAVGPVVTITPLAMAFVEDEMARTQYDQFQDQQRVDEIEQIRYRLQVQIRREVRPAPLYESVRQNLREALAQVEHAINKYRSEE